MPAAGDGPCGGGICGGWMATVAVLEPRGAESVQPGAVDAASEAASGACGGVSGPLPWAGRAGGRHAGHVAERGVDALTCGSIEGLVAHARRQIDQVERRLLRGETIPHEEKVFSIFEEHTRWVSKGKAGTPWNWGFRSR